MSARPNGPSPRGRSRSSPSAAPRRACPSRGPSARRARRSRASPRCRTRASRSRSRTRCQTRRGPARPSRGATCPGSPRPEGAPSASRTPPSQRTSTRREPCRAPPTLCPDRAGPCPNHRGVRDSKFAPGLTGYGNASSPKGTFLTVEPGPARGARRQGPGPRLGHRRALVLVEPAVHGGCLGRSREDVAAFLSSRVDFWGPPERHPPPHELFTSPSPLAGFAHAGDVRVMDKRSRERRLGEVSGAQAVRPSTRRWGHPFSHAQGSEAAAARRRTRRRPDR